MTTRIVDIAALMGTLASIRGLLSIRNDANATIESLRERLAELHERSEVIVAVADEEKRDLSEDEQKELDKINAEFEVTVADIHRREAVQARADMLNQPQGRRSEAEGPEDADHADEPSEDEPAVATRVHSRPSPAQAVTRAPYRQANRIEFKRTDHGKMGWRDPGEFMVAIARAGLSNNSNIDKRLTIRSAATTYGQEQTGQEGGFVVPPDFSTAIMTKVMGEDSLLSRCDQLTTQSNFYNLIVDNLAPWQTGGLRAYWDDEASTMIQSRPVFENSLVKLNRLTVLVPVSEEQLEDAPGMSSFINRKVPDHINFAINLAIVQGNGVGRMQGILTAPCTVSVAKETSQPTATLLGENIMKMWARMYGPCRANAVWLYNQDIEPQLQQLSLKIKNVAGTENVGGWPLYTPPGGLSGSKYSALYGRPMIPTEACNSIGTQGDIMLVDLQHYLAIMKAGGIRSSSSMHVWFDQNMMAFKFIFRIGGRPWWPNAVTRRAGSNTLSCFVVLDDRP